MDRDLQTVTALDIGETTGDDFGASGRRLSPRVANRAGSTTSRIPYDPCGW